MSLFFGKVPLGRKKRISLYGIILLEVVAINFILPSSQSTGEIPTSGICTPSNSLCSNIKFDTFVFGNSTLIDVTQLQSQPHQIVANESIVVVASGELNSVKVSSVTDTANDIFTRNVYTQSASTTELEIWTTVTSKSITNIITVTWNVTNNAIFGASYYFNVRAIGNSTSSNGISSPSTITLETIQSGSWITGGFAVSNPCSRFTVTLGVNRGQSCQSIVNDNALVSLDNSTTLPNNTFSTLQASYTGLSQFQGGAVELIASDIEPKNPNFNNFCTTTNGKCVTSQYSMNYAGVASAPNSGTVTLAPATAYCTGITSSALTAKSNRNIQVFSQWGGFDRNVTGITAVVQVYVSTVVPSTVFGVGLCSASGNVQVSSGTLYFPYIGTTGPAAVSSGFNGALNTVTLGTVYYSFIEVTFYNLGTAGHVQFNQVPGNANTFASISMLEVI